MTAFAAWPGSPRSRALAWTLGLGTAVGFVGLQVLRVANDGWSAFGADVVSGVLLVVSFVGLGTLLALRQPGNAIGWLLTAGGVTSLLAGAAHGFAERAVAAGQVTGVVRLAAAFDSNIWPLGVLCSVGLPLLLVPAGRLRTRAGAVVLGVRDDLLTVARRTMQPASAGPWLRAKR